MNKKVAIISGSIRKEGYSTQLGEALRPLFPDGYETEIVEIGQLGTEPADGIHSSHRAGQRYCPEGWVEQT